MSFLLGCVAVFVAATLIALVFGGVSKAKKKADGTGASQSGTVEGTAATGATDADCTAGTVVVNDDDAQKKTMAVKAEVKAKWPPDQCGLENDAEEWEEWEGPQRIKECQLSAAQQALCRKMLDLVFSDDTILGIKLRPDPQDVIDICEGVIPYLESEPVLIEDVPAGITIIGDLRGQLYDLDRVFAHAEVDGKPGWECAKYLFLGNYVDRGRQSVEIVLGLFCLKMLYPDRIFLLRGKHEYANINRKRYGLWDDLEDRYDEELARELYVYINMTFCFLSVAAIAGDKFLCVPSGISTCGFTRYQMRGIYKPIKESTDYQLIHDMTYSEPATGLRGTCFNMSRRKSFNFGFDALCTALDSMQVDAIIRGSKMMKEGFSVKWFVCHTVFTATNYGGSKNGGGICYVTDDGKMCYDVLDWCEKRTSWEKEIAVMEGSADPKAAFRYHKHNDAGGGDVVHAPKGGRRGPDA